MKDVQEFIPVIKNKITVVKIYYIKTKYIYEDGTEANYEDLSSFYSSLEKAEEVLNFFKENSSEIEDVNVEYSIDYKILEIDI